jgi:hypothetical protein
MFCYSDTQTHQPGSIVPYHRQNANAGYLRHYENYLYLDFILKTSDRMAERQQAAKELTICERKLKYWQQHANFIQGQVLPQVEKMKKQWQAK